MSTLLQKKSPAGVVGGAAFFAALLLIPVVFNLIGFSYGITIAVFIGIYVIAVSGLDIVFGYCGQISMGHAAFYAIGAYGSVLLTKHFHIPVLLTIFIAPVLAALVGALLAYPASKLVFHFLSLATIAFGEIVYQLVLQSPKGITGNAVGHPTQGINLFGLRLNNSFKFYYFLLACVILFILAKNNLVKSRVGRAFTAIRENPHAAEGMGINVRKYKVTAFSVSAFYTAFAGALYAHSAGYISPDTFTNKQSVMFITMLLFGGTASKAGPVIGVITVLLLNEFLRSMENLQMLVYGVLLLIVILMLPGGIFGMLENVFRKFIKKGGPKNA